MGYLDKLKISQIDRDNGTRQPQKTTVSLTSNHIRRSFSTAICSIREPRDAHSCWIIIVPNCPFCGKEHHHGGGPGNGDPHRYLTTRMSHCRKDRRIYALRKAI